MKKTNILLGSAIVLTSLLNAGSVFAEQMPNPDSAETPITATLNAANPGTPKPPVDPNDPNNGGNEENQVNGEGGKFGIAYYPKSFTFSGNLGKETLDLYDSSNSMSNEATYNVGVKDATRQNNKWTLTAKLSWDSDELPGSTITLNNSMGTVMQNENNGMDAFKTSNLINQQDVTGIKDVIINTTGSTEIMKKEQGTVGKGTYDYSLGKLGELKLTIPNATNLEAKTYSGKVNWNLSVTP
ncbi:WxL domain-containing protein [Enterococcus hirae]|nr:WxL domain-containing protein [Enterococcus hirae]EMF0102945.1 WxL domain-containing protein [Enterococcus hirae]EMF0126069.1 WxL domain-containing protein [Enterococcus hirae]EMF0477459.1 WxL domain-containing protein [Enterococcus hirae]EMF0574930.1 WxL domain-containing protein [Enterococcus hirae]MCA6767170.1 WxL domain-containing protein [Enterococcus hirae]